MRNTTQHQYVCAQQRQQQAQAMQLNSGFLSPQNDPRFLSPLYLQGHNGLQVVGLPMGAVMPPQVAVAQRGVPLQNGLLQQQDTLLHPGAQVWGAGVFPSHQQAPAFAHQFVQQQQQLTYVHDMRSLPGCLNGGYPQRHGGDCMRGQQIGHGLGGNGQLGSAPMRVDVRRPVDEARPTEFSPHGNGNPRSKPYENGYKAHGNWSSEGANGGSANPRFKGGRNEKGRGGETNRPQAVSFRCEECDRTFTSAQQFGAHKNTHVKCDVEGCPFEASGRVMKEHKQSAHSSSTSCLPATGKSKESEEEVLKWREERKRNYPTTANIKRKAEDMKARKGRGELVDDEARKRRERLKEILAKQAELGVPVAEVPAFYMSDRYGSLNAGGERGERSNSGKKSTANNGKRRHGRMDSLHGNLDEEDKDPPTKLARVVDVSNASDCPESEVSALELEVDASKETRSSILAEQLQTPVVQEDVVMDQKSSESCKTSRRICVYFKRGRCKKGKRCEFLHERRSHKKKDPGAAQTNSKRAPTLLAKLLESDIKREKSHLLQSFRFFVNNMFFLEFPEEPLKFSDWQEASNEGDRTADIDRVDAELRRLEQAAMGTGLEEGSDTDEDMESSRREQHSGEVQLDELDESDAERGRLDIEGPESGKEEGSGADDSM